METILIVAFCVLLKLWLTGFPYLVNKRLEQALNKNPKSVRAPLIAAACLFPHTLLFLGWVTAFFYALWLFSPLVSLLCLPAIVFLGGEIRPTHRALWRSLQSVWGSRPPSTAPVITRDRQGRWIELPGILAAEVPAAATFRCDGTTL